MDPVNQVTSRTGQIRRLASVYDIPENAIRLTDVKVLEIQWTLIKNWEPSTDMWPYRQASTILSTFGAMGGFICNNYFRQKFQLGSISRTASYIPAIALPAILGILTHHQWISNKILLGQFTCPLCAELRAGTIQATIGAFYPALISPLSSIVLARKHWTYPIPKITQPQEVFNMLWVTTYPFKYTFAGVVLLQFLIGMGITKHQLRVFHEKLSSGVLPDLEQNPDMS